jgi:hypothetical protein
MTLPPGSRCPGGGMQMVSRIYVVRKIESAHREKHAWRIARAEERGDPDEAEIIKRHLAKAGDSLRLDLAAIISPCRSTIPLAVLIPHVPIQAVRPIRHVLLGMACPI